MPNSAVMTAVAERPLSPLGGIYYKKLQVLESNSNLLLLGGGGIYYNKLQVLESNSNLLLLGGGGINKFTEHMQQFLYSNLGGGGVIYYMKSIVLESNFQTQTYYFWGEGGNLLHINLHKLLNKTCYTSYSPSN